jgi:hypothetical protein
MIQFNINNASQTYGNYIDKEFIIQFRKDKSLSLINY